MAQRSLLFVFLLISVVSTAQVSLSGTVIDGEKQPLPGATVSLLEQQVESKTDAEGRFKFDDVEKGMVVLNIDYGYLHLRDTISLEEDRHITYELEREIEKDMVIVEATRARSNTPVTKSTISREEIEDRNLGQDVPYLLKWAPSVTVTSDAGTGIGYTGIRIRGSDLTRINVTLNGIPLNDAESQGVFWVDLPDLLSSVDDIQIQRGVGTSTQGAGAFGATIDLNTGLHQSDPYGWVSGTAGSFNTYKATVAFGSGMINDKFSVEGRLSSIDSEGYIDRASSDLESYYLSGNYVGERSSLRFNLISGHEQTYQAWYGVPVQYVDDSELRNFNPAGTEKPGAPYEDQIDDYTQTHYQLLFDQKLRNNWSLGLAAHYTRGYGYYEEYKADQLLNTYGLDPIMIGDSTQNISDLTRRRWLDNHFYGGIGSVVKGFEEGGHLRIGGGWNQYDGLHYGEVLWAEYYGEPNPEKRYYENDALKTDWNIYTKITWPVFDNGSAFLDLQYRHVNYSFQGLDEDGTPLDQTVDHPFFNPKAGFSFDFDRGWRIYSSIAVAHKEPNRDDYVETSMDSRPEPEELINLEMGADKRARAYNVGANVYYMHYNDQLVNTGEINDVGAYTRRNVENSYRIGLELKGKWKPAPAWTLQSFWTLSRNRIEDVHVFIDNWDTGQQVSESLDETEIPFSPKVNGSLRVGWQREISFGNTPQFRISADLTGKYIGRQYLDIRAVESASLDPYTYVDGRVELSTEKGPFQRIAFNVMVRNLLDARYNTNGWLYPFISENYDPRADDPYVEREQGNGRYHQKGLFPQAGRNVLAGLRIEF